jgi:Bacterial protein of unknown function (DUF899)
MAGAGTGHALRVFQAFDPPLKGHTFGRAAGQPDGLLVVLPGRGVATGSSFPGLMIEREVLMGCYPILDRAPKGRDEGDQPMSWLRRHDEYRHR